MARYPLLATLFCTALLFAALPLRGQEKTEGDKALEELGWAVGGKWISEIKGENDKPLTVESTFEWAGHRKSLKYVVVFKSQGQTTTQYEGLYYWDPEKKHVAMLQIDRQGNINHSVLTKEGDEYKQQNTVTLADGKKREQRAEFKREGDDAFSFKAYIRKGEDWVDAITLKYKRVRD